MFSVFSKLILFSHNNLIIDPISFRTIIAHAWVFFCLANHLCGRSRAGINNSQLAIVCVTLLIIRSILLNLLLNFLLALFLPISLVVLLCTRLVNCYCDSNFVIFCLLLIDIYCLRLFIWIRLLVFLCDTRQLRICVILFINQYEFILLFDLNIVFTCRRCFIVVLR